MRDALRRAFKRNITGHFDAVWHYGVENSNRKDSDLDDKETKALLLQSLLYT